MNFEKKAHAVISSAPFRTARPSALCMLRLHNWQRRRRIAADDDGNDRVNSMPYAPLHPSPPLSVHVVAVVCLNDTC